MPRHDRVLLDHVQTFVSRVSGPDDAVAEIHVYLNPFRLEVVTDQGLRLTVQALSHPGAN